MMADFFKKGLDAYTAAKIWTIFVILSQGIFLIVFHLHAFSLEVLGIWIFSCIILIYLSKRNIEYLDEKQKIIVIVIGFFICVLSFISIPLGISNPPYSIGEYSLLLSGIGLIFFGLLKMRTLLFPVLIQFIAVIGYDLYQLFLRHENWLTAPLIPFIISLCTAILNGIGIQTITNGNIITFLAQNGDRINLLIIGECTGIISLGTFTIAVIIVMAMFPQSITRKSIGFIALGYIGTFAVNILRIVMIALTGYIFGQSEMIQYAHQNIGWIVFSLWMIIFWYYYFTRQIGVSFFNKGSKLNPEKD